MKILYDGLIYEMQTKGGINRYFSNIIQNLPDSFSPTITTSVSNSIQLIHPKLQTYYYSRYGFRPGRLSCWLEKYYFRAVSAINQFDLVHPTYYTTLTRTAIKNFAPPVVLTVHDMIHELFPDQLDSSGNTRSQKKNAILAAQAIICPSENTKRDLLNFFPGLEEKIAVTHLASEIDVRSSFGHEIVPSSPYYLYVGGRFPYKNFDRVLQAFANISSNWPDLLLCVVGSPFKDHENQLITELKINEQVKHYCNLSDSHLAKLYRCSIALIYPSLYEGFGIPPLEAMSCGTAVVASNSSSLPEVIGDAGLLVDPTSGDELTDALLSLLKSSGLRDQLIQKGFERAKLFSWSITAKETLRVYKSVSG